jgi:hypothetical protein
MVTWRGILGRKVLLYSKDGNSERLFLEIENLNGLNVVGKRKN